MPCLNEAETVEVCISKAQSFLESNNITGEIIIADNGSTDGSQALAEKAGARVVHISEKGYGSALIGGIAAAEGEYIIMGDADDSYDFSELGAFVEALDAGADLVMGNRFQGGISPGAMPFLHKYLGNPVLSGLGRLFFKSNFGDFHCGLRGFRKDSILSLGLQTTGMEFASEMAVKASLQGLEVVEVPIILYPDGRSRSPHLRTWPDGWRHLRFLLMYSPRWLFFYPGIILTVLGLLISAYLLPGPRAIGSVTFDINTLMYASFFVILGFQSIFFFLFSKVFGISVGLLPPDLQIEKMMKILTLERGIIIGGLMILLGVGSSIAALVYWSQNYFGVIDPAQSMRLVIPGVMMFSVGVQLVFASFFISILLMKRK